MNYKGIDVSYAQGQIDWAKVKNEVDFAIIRIGFIGKKDKWYETNYKQAKANGIALGGYFYSYAQTIEDARREAYECIGFIKGKKFEYPIWYDLEEARTRKQGKRVISAIAQTFCDILEQNGYFAGIYSNKAWLSNYYNKSVLDRYDVWIAQYNNKVTWDGKYGIWQYSSKGKVDGIKGNVDMDVSYKDYPAIIKANKLNGYTATEPKKATSQTTGTKVEKLSKKVTTTANKGNSVLKKGNSVRLVNAKLYKSATTDKASKTINGTYYVYDGEIINGRYRITNNVKNVGRKPMAFFVTGWIKL